MNPSANPSPDAAPVVAAPPAPAPAAPLGVVLRLTTHDAALAHEPVRPEDLIDHIAETWREGCLRKGRTHVTPAGLPMQTRPLLQDRHSPRCLGFAVELQLPGGETASADFSVFSLERVARRAADRLLTQGKLQSGQQYRYEVVTQAETARSSARSRAARKQELDFEVRDRSPALNWLEVPLRPLLDRGAPQEPLDEDAFHVFFTANAWARAERCARKGAEFTPAVETGAVLVGALCSCPDTRDCFVVVTDAYEVLDAEQQKFSLTYTGKSWGRIQTVLQARRAICPALRLVGQFHGHNFLPAGGQTCEACPSRPVCDLTNIYASEDDQIWTRASFTGQPWALCAIAGHSARGDKVSGLFTQHDARLRRRGCFIIPEFHPEQWPCRQALTDHSPETNP